MSPLTGAERGPQCDSVSVSLDDTDVNIEISVSLDDTDLDPGVSVFVCVNVCEQGFLDPETVRVCVCV